MSYPYILIPILVLITNQITKFTIESIKKKELVFRRLFNGSGGMPSTHTSFIFSITTLIGLKEGFNTPLFGLALCMSFIVAYDSMGVRFETGRQAVSLNRIIDELEQSNFKLKLKDLKEEVGHRPKEVLVGMIFGIIVTYILTFMI